MNKQRIAYVLGLTSLLAITLFGCTNDNIRVMSQSGILVTPTPEVTPTTNPRLVGVPTEWSDGVKHFPITPVDADGLTIPQTRQMIVSTIQAIYPENATLRCYEDFAAYEQKVFHSFTNLFAHPSSDGVPFDQIAADAGISVASTYSRWSTAVPQLFTFTENHAIISIPDQYLCYSHYDSYPSLYIFDRQQNVYCTNVYGHVRQAQL